MQTYLGLLKSAITGTATQIPQGIKPVENFNVDRYLGTWHENARLEQPFQKGMRSVTATYRLQDDGGITVVNKGIDPKGKQQQSVGKAYFVGNPDDKIAHLKVSFFGPLYGSYVVFGLDHDDYQYAFVTGSDKSYLWLLSRNEKIDPELKNKFIASAEQYGFETSHLIWADQQQAHNENEATSLNAAPCTG